MARPETAPASPVSPTDPSERGPGGRNEPGAGGGEAFRAAMARAGRLLAVRPRTAREMSERLAAAGFDEPVTAAALARLVELDLIDDAAFARRWVTERAGRKGLGAALLVSELLAKGVSREVAEDAVASSAGDESRRAAEAAAGYVRRVAGLPLSSQARRIEAFLLRRGFGAEEAEFGVRAVLPPEGWD